MSTSIAIYVFQIKEIRKPYLILSDLNLSKIFNGFFDCVNATKPNDYITTIEKYSMSDKDCFKLQGNIENGLFTPEQNIVNRERITVTTKKNNEAVTDNFFFQICIPLNAKKGIIAFQRNGTHGIKTRFLNTFNSYLKTINNEYLLELNSITPNEFIRDIFMNWNIDEIEFITHEPYKNNADILENGNFYKNITKAKHKFQLNKSYSKRLPKQIIKNISSKVPISSLIEVPDIEYDDIKTTLHKYNGNKIVKSKSVTISKMYRDNSIAGYIDISDELKYEDETPTLQSLKKVFTEYVDDFINRLGRDEKI